MLALVTRLVTSGLTRRFGTGQVGLDLQRSNGLCTLLQDYVLSREDMLILKLQCFMKVWTPLMANSKIARYSIVLTKRNANCTRLTVFVGKGSHQ